MTQTDGATRARRMRPGTRKAVLAAHIVGSVGWIGVSASMVVLSLVGLATEHPGIRAGTYHGLAVLDETVMGIAALLSLVTGVWLALGTPFGLIRHWWVVVKQILFTLVMIGAFGFTHGWVLGGLDEALRTGQPTGDGRALAFGAPVMLILLIATAVVSVYKPGGRTPRGRRQVSRSSGTREVTVTEVRPLAEDVVGLTLADRKGGELPAWEPGAHVDLVLPSGLVRQYSLCGDPADRTSYQVAVLLERDGRGGSREIHRLRPGQRIGVRGPRNNFPLVDAPAYLFVAGGIGVTPLLPMIREVAARGLPWRLAYLGRSPRTMAFAADLRASAGVRLYPKDAGRRADLAELVRTAPPATHVYACGPHRLMDALERMVPAERLHVEHFAAAADTAPKRPFTAELARTGATVAVPAGRTLLDAVREYAPGLEASCENGVCGTCRITVLRGTPEHRDSVLQPAERGRTDVVYACVSRSKSQRLVLDV